MISIHRHYRKIAKGVARSTVVAVLAGSVLGCSLTDVQDPSAILDPDLVKSEQGALGLYRTARSQFFKTYGGFLSESELSGSFASSSGLAADEYSAKNAGARAWYNLRLVQSLGPGNQDEPYSGMHKTRLYIDEATGALREYGLTTPKAYIAELQALQGFIYTMFGELYCSGIPFGKAIYGGDIAHGTPLTTQQMFEQAIMYFDSAAVTAVDSLPVKRLVWIGKARALVNLGRFTEAAALVSQANVPTSFVYQYKYTDTPFQPHYLSGTFTDNAYFFFPYFRMANRAGGNGLNYVEAGDPNGNPDPRMLWYSGSAFNGPGEYPLKFRGASPLMALADGIEARLIEAEAKLQAKDYAGWQTALNTLRQTGLPTPIAELPADSTTTAPDSVRVSVMFRERAFWLFGTGHRFGDMRRLVRQYGRATQQVFPQGVQAYLSSPDNIYSSLPVLEPPKRELDNNGNYKGCFNHDA